MGSEIAFQQTCPAFFAFDQTVNLHTTKDHIQLNITQTTNINKITSATKILSNKSYNILCFMHCCRKGLVYSELRAAKWFGVGMNK